MQHAANLVDTIYGVLGFPVQTDKQYSLIHCNQLCNSLQSSDIYVLVITMWTFVLEFSINNVQLHFPNSSP